MIRQIVSFEMLVRLICKGHFFKIVIIYQQAKNKCGHRHQHPQEPIDTNLKTKNWHKDKELAFFNVAGSLPICSILAQTASY